MRRECQERFPRHRGAAIPTCIPVRAWRTCRDACRDCKLWFLFSGREKVPGIPSACAMRIFTYPGKRSMKRFITCTHYWRIESHLFLWIWDGNWKPSPIPRNCHHLTRLWLLRKPKWVECIMTWSLIRGPLIPALHILHILLTSGCIKSTWLTLKNWITNAIEYIIVWNIYNDMLLHSCVYWHLSWDSLQKW